MKTLIANCVLVLLLLPMAPAQASDSVTDPPSASSAESSEPTLTLPFSTSPTWEQASPGGSCHVTNRCTCDLDCELACGQACGPLYGGRCVPSENLGLSCQCSLMTIE